MKEAARDKVDAEKVAQREIAAAARATAREQVAAAKDAARAAEAASAAAIAAAEKEAAARVRLEAVAQAAIDRRANQIPRANPATSRIGRTVPREETGQKAIPLSYLNGATTVAEAAPALEQEINHLMADRFDLAQKIKVAEGETKRELQDQAAYLSSISRYKQAGLSEDAAILRAEEQQASVAKLRAERQAIPAGGNRLRSASRFAEGTILGRTGGNGAAVAGIATAAAFAGGAAIVGEATKTGKEIQDTAQQLGLSTKDLQVYQVAAQRAGATNEQLSSAFAHLADQIGRAKEGDAAVTKLFSKDNLNIDPTSFKTLGDALPTVIDRLSKIEDPVKRSAVGVRLFGDEYRRLDPLLSSGNEKLKDLAISLGAAILSDSQIDNLDETAKKLADVNRALQADLAKTVADNASSITSLAGALGSLTGEIVRFLNSHPELALTIIGALAGGKVGGPIGAAIGGVAGNITGQKISEAQSDGNRDLGFRRQQYQAAQQELVARQRATSSGSFFSFNRNAAADGGSRSGNSVADAEREVARQRGLYQQAQAFARAHPDKPQGAVQTGKPGSLRTAFAPNPPKGPKGRSAESLDAEEQARTKRFQDELAALQEQELRAQAEQTGSIEKRAKIETDLVDRALAKQVGDGTKEHPGDIELERRRNVDKGENAAEAANRANQLKAAAVAAANSQKKNIEDEKTLSITAATNQSLQTQLNIEGQSLAVQAQLATTRKERLALELKGLANQEKQERANLQGQLDQLKPDDVRGRANVQQQIDALPGKYQQQGQLTRQGNLSPLDAYRQQLKGAVGDNDALRDSFEQVAVNGIGRVEDQLSSTIGKVFGLKGAFGDLISSVLTDLAKIELKKGILALLGGGKGGDGSSGGTGGFLSGLVSSVAGLFGGGKGGGDDFDYIGLTGFANGGSATIGGNPGVDQNVLSINGRPSLKVGRGEQLTVTPQAQISPNNSRVASAAPSITVVQPIHADFTGARTDEQTMREFTRYADAKSTQAYEAAVRTAAGQAPAAVRQYQNMKE